MPEHDFDSFKQYLHEWMDSHSGEYDAFEAGMNRRDDAGYQMVIAVAMGLAPEYEKIVSQRINRGPDGGDISDIERLFSESGLAEALIGDDFGSGLTTNLLGNFEDIRKESIVPAMLCWLYFGQSFERMVERGEELRHSLEISYHEKIMIVQTIKLLVDKSAELGLRTKADWVKHHSWMKLADSDDALDWALATPEQPVEKKKPGRPSTASPLAQMFAPAAPKKLVEKIGEYLTIKHSQSDIARLKIALDELRFLVSPVNIKSFRDALSVQFAPNIHIVHERGIQEAYSRLTSTVTINGIKVMVANRNEDRAAIDEIKDFLRR